MIAIALDNGHGINTPGKRTPLFTDGTTSPYTGKNFMHEWEFNRRVVQLLSPMLERCGFKVFEMSATDEDTPVNDRWKRANDLHVAYFLSVHANAMGDGWGNANGIETLVSKGGSDEAYRIGRIIQKHMVEATGLHDRCTNMHNGLYERDDVGVLTWTKMPANLIECGFMDNATEAKLLLSDDYRKLCATALCKAICEAHDVSYKPEEVPVVKGPTMSDVFNDVPAGHWCEQNLKDLKEAGIISGYGDGSFKGDQPITRYELVSILARFDAYVKGVK